MARTVFHCTVSELRQRISSSELTDWKALYNIEPWGDCRDDFRMGQICATLVNSRRTNQDKVRKPSDFYPIFKQEKQTVEEQIAILKGVSNG